MNSEDDDLNNGGSIHDLQHAPDLCDSHNSLIRHHSPFRSRLHSIDVVSSTRSLRQQQSLRNTIGNIPLVPLTFSPSSVGTGAGEVSPSSYSRRRFWSADNAAAAARAGETAGGGMPPRAPSMTMTGQSSLTGYYSQAFNSSFPSENLHNSHNQNHHQRRRHRRHESGSSFSSNEDRLQRTSNRSVLSGLSNSDRGGGGGGGGGGSHSNNYEYHNNDHSSSAMQIPEISDHTDSDDDDQDNIAAEAGDYGYDDYGYGQEESPKDGKGGAANKRLSSSDHQQHHRWSGIYDEQGEDDSSSRYDDKDSSSSSSTDHDHEEEDDDDHDHDHVDDEDDGNASQTSVGDLAPSCRKILGIAVPKLPNLSQVALTIVTYAPCFCCFGFRMRTDRIVLGRLNVLLACVSLYQIASGMFLAIVMLSTSLVGRALPPQALTPVETSDDDISDPAARMTALLWNVNGNIFITSVLALVNFISAVVTFRVVRYVNLVGAIRYLWVLSWTLTFETYSAISLFDYHMVSIVWIKHWWRQPTMAWFRTKSCAAGTAYTLCTVPILSNLTSEDEWCRVNYNSTSCVQIRSDAQNWTFTFLRIFYTFSACWTILVVLMTLLTMDTLEHIISKPLVRKSKQSNIPLWLSLPMIGCIGIGLTLSISGRTTVQYLGPNYRWISYALLVIGGLFLVAILSGWFASTSSIERTSDKHSKLLAVYTFIGTLISADLLLIAVFGTAISFSTSLVNNPISDTVRGEIACTLGGMNGGCTRCGMTENRCPEWTTEDITAVFKSQALSIATCCAIFIVYAIGAIRFGFSMRKHISTYQIEYV